MPSREITVQTSGGVCTITIRRAHKRNALAPAHLVALREALLAAGSDPACRVVVLTGEGQKAFCAGADLSGEAAFFAPGRQGATTELGDLIRARRTLDQPLIGRINGACYAGGMGLLALCDLAIASAEATFALPEINVGLFPFVVLAAFADHPAQSTLRELAITGQPIAAARAEQTGLITRQVPLSDLDAQIDSLAQSIARKPPQALRAGRAALRQSSDAAFLAALAEAEARSLALSQQPEAREGLAAFREKRPSGAPHG